MSNIDISRIRSGDEVTYRYCDSDMRAAAIQPKESAGQVYGMGKLGKLLCVDGYALEHDDLIILAHKPQRPDWVDALVIRSEGEGETCYYVRRYTPQGDGFVGADGEVWEDWRDLKHYRITIIIDAEGRNVEAERLRAELDKARDLILARTPLGDPLLPPEPPKGSIVVDHGGVQWRHYGSAWRDDVRQRSWFDLAEHGPLTLVHWGGES